MRTLRRQSIQHKEMMTLTQKQKELADALGKMFSFAVDILNFDSKYFLSMLNELGTSKLFEEGTFTSKDLTIYKTVKEIIMDMVNEEVTEPFRYNTNSDAYILGYFYCLFQQSSGLSFKEIEQIIDSL